MWIKGVLCEPRQDGERAEEVRQHGGRLHSNQNKRTWFAQLSMCTHILKAPNSQLSLEAFTSPYTAHHTPPHQTPSLPLTCHGPGYSLKSAPE